MPGSAVLGPANGPVPCRLMFIGEAPGRRGAARTQIPFSGDESGRRFELLLAAAGLDRGEVFITNAMLCLPLDAAGCNRTPRASELASCSANLSATLAAVSPELVVTLGAIALAACVRIEVHRLALASGVAQPAGWFGRTLIPLYHPGRQAQLHRPWDRQLEDWRKLGHLVRSSVAMTEPRPW